MQIYMLGVTAITVFMFCMLLITCFPYRFQSRLHSMKQSGPMVMLLRQAATHPQKLQGASSLGFPKGYKLAPSRLDSEHQLFRKQP